MSMKYTCTICDKWTNHTTENHFKWADKLESIRQQNKIALELANNKTRDNAKEVLNKSDVLTKTDLINCLEAIAQTLYKGGTYPIDQATLGIAIYEGVRKLKSS